MFSLEKAICAFNPKLQKIIWPNFSETPVHEYRSEISIRGMIGKGCGFAVDEPTALLISIAESIERVVCIFNKLKTTNGVAVHVCTEKARFNSIKEYIERYAFLLKFYSGHLSGFEIPIIKEFRNYKQTFQNVDIKTQIISKVSCEKQDFFVILTTCKVEKAFGDYGYIFGLGCDSTTQKAQFKSESEVFQLLNHAYSSKFKSTNLDLFTKMEYHDFEDHGMLALSADYSRLINKAVSEAENKVNNINLKLIVKELELPDEINELKLKCFQTRSEDGIELFTGFPTGIHIEKLIQNGLKHDLSMCSDLLKLPHPLA